MSFTLVNQTQTMKNLVLSALAVISFIGFTGNLFAQGASKTQAATAQITTALTFASGSDLKFGSIAVGASTGTVTLTPASSTTRTKVGSTTQLVSQGTSPAAAAYTVNGEPGYTFTVTLPSSPVTITNTTGSGGETMTVTDFTTDLTSDDGTLTGGTATFYVGGTLNVGAAQVSGAYTGNFDVTVAYD
jgi:hypothetical protein